MQRIVVSSCRWWLPWLLILYVHATPAWGDGGFAAAVQTVEGSVTVERAGRRQPVAVNTKIYPGDHLSVPPKATTVIRVPAFGYFTLSARTRLEIDRYYGAPAGAADSVLETRLYSGTLRYVAEPLQPSGTASLRVVPHDLVMEFDGAAFDVSVKDDAVLLVVNHGAVVVVDGDGTRMTISSPRSVHLPKKNHSPLR